MRRNILIFLLCICLLNLSSCRLNNDNNSKELEINCIHSGFAKYNDYNINTNSFWVIRDLEEWRNNRNKYIPTVNLVPAIDIETLDFEEYDLILLKGGIEENPKYYMDLKYKA